MSAGREQRSGLMIGLLGILSFSLTLPMTRLAVSGLDPWLVGLGRALVAALLASIPLLVTRQRPPRLRDWPRFALVAGGVVIGFPLLSTLAMREVSASHGAIVIALLPLATALGGVIRDRERPPFGFWLCALAGASLVLVYALQSGAGGLAWADGLLLGAVLAAAIGYTEGALLTRQYGAWQVIAWALVLCAPLLAPLLFLLDWVSVRAASPGAWLGFLYVSAISMFLGFVAWYRGLALGGIARVGQVQLLQPFFTIGFAWALFGETVSRLTCFCAAGVLLCVTWGLRARASGAANAVLPRASAR